MHLTITERERIFFVRLMHRAAIMVQDGFILQVKLSAQTSASSLNFKTLIFFVLITTVIMQSIIHMANVLNSIR